MKKELPENSNVNAHFIDKHTGKCWCGYKSMEFSTQNGVKSSLYSR